MRPTRQFEHSVHLAAKAAPNGQYRGSRSVAARRKSGCKAFALLAHGHGPVAQAKKTAARQVAACIVWAKVNVRSHQFCLEPFELFPL